MAAKTICLKRIIIAVLLACLLVKYSSRDHTESYGGAFSTTTQNLVGTFSTTTENLMGNDRIHPVIRNNQTDYYLCPFYQGGLGNQMFIFASSYGISRQRGMKVLITPKSQLLKVFNLNYTFVKISQMPCPKPYKTLKEKYNAVFDKRLITFPISSNMVILNFLQSFRYFDKYSNEIKNQFTFKQNILNKAKHLMFEELRKDNIICKKTTDKRSRQCYDLQRKETVLIGCHIRRGDWLTPRHVELGFQTASKEYLIKAVKWFRKKYANIVFIVASNGMKWAKDNFPSKNTIIFLPENNLASTHLAILSLCNHFLGTVGTFSWWAGWLTGGDVTYFKWPARENSKFRPTFGYNFSDHFYPKWIGF